ncbi:MAG: adenosine-specific kinase [Candidatus Aenigmatarchaeota archaeon]|nr:adenosine-specific kinase [Candidatus Aenigmarchaeota archaeon]
MEIKTVKIEVPKNCNFILLSTHFIMSVEDIYEAIVKSVPGIKFGLAFCEASGPCLIRIEGTDKELIKLASETAMKIAAGHTAIIFIKDAYPINILNSLKNLPEVCKIDCATANEVEVIVADNGKGRGILGVIDGEKAKGVENEKDIKERKEFLRKIKYKL